MLVLYVFSYSRECSKTPLSLLIQQCSYVCILQMPTWQFWTHLQRLLVRFGLHGKFTDAFTLFCARPVYPY
jgi:hypothetical protein